MNLKSSEKTHKQKTQLVEDKSSFLIVRNSVDHIKIENEFTHTHTNTTETIFYPCAAANENIYYIL